MRYLISGIISAVFLILGISNAGDKNEPQQNMEYKEISQDEAKNRLDSEKDIILLDVRTKEEYDEKHIPNSTLIPLDVIDKEAEAKIPDKSSKIFVYCRSGHRSKLAAIRLLNQGYSNISDIGGIMTWKYETESSK